MPHKMEELCVVDEHDHEQVGCFHSHLVHSSTPILPHRVTGLMIIRGKKELLIHQRSATKDPAMPWMHCFGGHVRYQEDLTQSALRELQEETMLELSPQNILHIGKHFDPPSGHMDHVFVVQWDSSFGNMTFDKKEIHTTKWMPIEDAIIASQQGFFRFPLYPSFVEYVGKRKSSTFS